MNKFTRRLLWLAPRVIITTAFIALAYFTWPTVPIFIACTAAYTAVLFVVIGCYYFVWRNFWDRMP